MLVRPAMGAEIKRTHAFVRSIAMGDAFTAVADSHETIGYNPAGLYQKEIEWSLAFPLAGLGFNDIVKEWNNSETERDFTDTETLKDLPGKRIWLEVQVPGGLTDNQIPVFLPYLFIPDKGFYTGFDVDAWLEIAFPPQTIIPTVSLEAVGQAVYDLALAVDLWGLTIGSNAKLIYRQGVVADLDLISIAAYLENEDFEGLIDEYGGDQPDPKVVFDFGVLYRFDHPWNFRIGLSALDAVSANIGAEQELLYGGVDYGSAGEVVQLNSIGFALTKQVEEFDMTASLDYHDFTYSYFPDDSLNRRICIGFEAGYNRKPDNSHMASIQLGLKELKYPSFGFGLTLGALEFNTVRWIENFGTEETEILDTRYMFLISIVF